MSEGRNAALGWYHPQHRKPVRGCSRRDTDRRRIFFTGKAFRRAFSICAPLFRSTSLSQKGSWRWKATDPLTAVLVLLERLLLRMTRSLPTQPVRELWDLSLCELFTFSKDLDSWAMLHSHSLTWREKTLLSRRFLFRYQNLRRTDGWVAKAFEIRTAQQSLSLSPALLVGLCLGRYLLGRGG